MTTHIYHFTIPLFITISSLCYAMNKELNISPAEIITTIPTTNRSQSFCLPKAVIFLSNETIATLENDICYLYNFHQKIKPPTRMANTTIQTIAKHPKKPLLALLCKSVDFVNNDILTLHDTSTGNQISRIDEAHLNGPIIFDSSNETFIICTALNTLNIYNYNGTLSAIIHLNPMRHGHLYMAFNPIKQEGIMIEDNSRLMLLKPDRNSFSIEKFFEFSRDVVMLDCKYNYNGSLIAFNDSIYKCRIFDRTSKKLTSLIIPDTNNIGGTNETVHGMAFHPARSILATFSLIDSNKNKSKNKKKKETTYTLIRYWDALTQKIIISTYLAEHTEQSSINHSIFGFSTNRINFSPDGTQLIIALINKYIVLKAPFDIVYQPGTKNKCILTWLILKNYFYNGRDFLPSDIRRILIYNLLALSKF